MKKVLMIVCALAAGMTLADDGLIPLKGETFKSHTEYRFSAE